MISALGRDEISHHREMESRPGSEASGQGQIGRDLKSQDLAAGHANRSLAGGAKAADSEREGFKGRERTELGERGEKPFGAKRPFAGAPRPFRGDRPSFAAKPGFERPKFERPSGDRGTGKPGGFGDRPKFGGQRPFAGGPRPDRSGSKFGAKRPFGGGRPAPGQNRGFERPRPEGAGFSRPGFSGGPRGRSEGQRGDATRRPFRSQGERPQIGPSGPPKLRIDSVPGKSFERGPEKSWTPSPDRPRSEGPRERAGGAERSAPAFRGKSWPGNGADSGAGRAKPAFGGRPAGFTKPNRPGGGSRPGGFAKRDRPGGFVKRDRPGGGAKRGGPRFGGGRPGGR